jgi:hypothetical protein
LFEYSVHFWIIRGREFKANVFAGIPDARRFEIIIVLYSGGEAFLRIGGQLCPFDQLSE